MNAALAHRGPDGDGFYDMLRASRSAIAGWRSSIAPAAISRCRTRTAPAGSSSTARSTTTGILRPVLESRGHVFRTRSDTETILHAYEEFGTACVDTAGGHVRLRDLRRAPAASCSPRGIGSARSRSSTRSWTRCFTLRASCRRSRDRRCGRATSTSASLEGYLSLGYFIAPSTIFRDVYKLQPGHWLRVADGRVEVRRVLGCAGIRYGSPLDGRASRRHRRDASAGGVRSSRERGAAWGLPERRHRLRPGRVVHGRSARRSARHDDRRLRRRRSTTSSKPRR